MAQVGTLSVSVEARIANFVKNLDQAQLKAQQFANKLNQMGNADYFSPMRKSLQGMKRDFTQIVQGIVLAQTFYQGIQLFKNLTAAVYEYTDALDYAKVTFSNLFQDASLGEEFVYVLQQYAARSPFDFTDIEKAARQLAAYGIEAENLMFVMQGIGNLAAVTGDPQTFSTVSRAIGQIYAKGKLTAEEMRQLAEAGLNVKAVYERLGVDADNLATSNINAADAINTIIDVLNDKYAGAMTAANMTMRGILGNLKDVLLSVSSAIYMPSYKTMQRVLLGIQEQINKFQETFIKADLKTAIEETFGAGTLTKLQQFVAILSMVGNTIYQLLVPALKIFAMYGQSVITVIGLLGQVLLPIVQVFAALLNSLLQNATAVRILQAALVTLAIVKIIGSFASMLNGVLNILTSTFGRVTTTASAARNAMLLFSYSMRQGATASVAAGNAFRYFTKTLKANPFVVIISLILTLISAIAGLRAVLGYTTDSLAEFSGVDTSKIFEGISMGTGDLEKFNNRLDDTNEGLDDANDALDSAKKKQKDLLSFDEVFRLNDTSSNYSPSYGDDADTSDIDVGDLSDYMPEAEEAIDWHDLIPDINTLFDWFADQPWYKIGEYILKGISDALIGTPVKSVARSFVETFGDSLSKAGSKEVRSFLKSLRKGTATWENEGKALAESLEKGLADELTPAEIKKLKIPEKIKNAINESTKRAKLGESAGKEFGENFTKTAAKTITISDIGASIKTIFTKNGAQELFKSFTSSLKKAFTPKNIKSFMKLSLKDMGLTIIGEMIFAEIATWLDENGYAEASHIVDKLGPILASAIGSGIATKSWKGFGSGAIIGALFEDFETSLDTGYWGNTFTTAASGFSVLLTEKILPKFGKTVSKGLKRGSWAAAIGSMVSGFIFESIEEDMLANGDEAGAHVVSIIDSTLSNALTGAVIGTAILPGIGTAIGALVGGIIGLIVGAWEDICKWWEDTSPTYLKNMGQSISVPGYTYMYNTGTTTMGGMKVGLQEGLDKITGFINKTLPSTVNGELQAMYEEMRSFFELIARKVMAAFTGGLEEGNEEVENEASETMPIIDEAFQEKYEAFKQHFQLIADSIMRMFTGGLAEGNEEVQSEAQQVVPDTADTLQNGYNTNKGLFQTLGSNVLSMFKQGAQSEEPEIRKNAKQIIPNMQTALSTAYNTVKTSFSTIGSNIIGMFKSGVTHKNSELQLEAKKVIPAFDETFKNKYAQYKASFTAVGTNVMNSFHSGIKTGNNATQATVANVQVQTKNKFSNAGTWLTNAGQQVMSGLRNGITNGGSAVVTKVQSVSMSIKNSFTGTENWLSKAGQNIINGLRLGLQNATMINYLKTTVSNLKSYITGTFRTDWCSNWLYNAGQWIVYGLQKGMVDYFNNNTVQVVRSMATWIRNNKGPEQYDRQLLVDNGLWIMSGLLNGLNEGFEDVLTTVRTYAPAVSQALGTPILTTTRASVPTIPYQPVQATQQSTQEVANPYVSQDTSSDASRPIMYVGTLIADKQGLRELQKKLDVINSERSRTR